ncbi:MAG: HEAT repeat domain-containing protein [Myxococcota bacterium]
MGLFDRFGPKGREARVLKKHGARVANRRAQNVDRWDSIRALSSLGSPEAVEALLRRFTFRVDPSITDQEEKDAAFQAIVAAGEDAVPSVVHALRRGPSIAWPLKCLEQLVSEEELVGTLLGLLSDMSTEYERDPDRKIQVLGILEEHSDPRIASAVLPFLEDVNETARFHAVGTLLAQPNAETASKELFARLGQDDSLRLRVKLLDGFIDSNWAVPDSVIAAVRENIPSGYHVSTSGKISRGGAV